MADWASESGHWYDRFTGEPRYTIVGANGAERDTTLRDAKKYGYVPSVTTISACAARFQLERWKAEQLLLAGLTLPRLPDETEAAWVERVWIDSGEQAKKAAERGTKIHAAVEAYYDREPYDLALEPWVDSIGNLIKGEFGTQEWRPEKCFASPLGYGGKVDLHSDAVLLDFKGKEGDRSKWKVYDEYQMQLAAYAYGLGLHGASLTEIKAICGIIFFDRNEPYSEFHEVKPPELGRGWGMFRPLLDYWYAKTGLQR